MGCAVVLLRDLVNGEVADINVRRQLWLERCTNLAKLIPDDSSKEWMFLNRRGAIMSSAIVSKAIFGVTQEAID